MVPCNITLTMYCQLKRRVRESVREGLALVHVVIVDAKTRNHAGNAFPPWAEHYVAVSCIRACLHRGGGPQVGEETRLGGVTCLSV